MFGRKKKEFGRQYFTNFKSKLLFSEIQLRMDLADHLNELGEKCDKQETITDHVVHWMYAVSAALVIVTLRENKDKSIAKSTEYFYLELEKENDEIILEDVARGGDFLVGMASEGQSHDIFVLYAGLFILKGASNLPLEEINEDFAKEIGILAMQNMGATINGLEGYV